MQQVAGVIYLRSIQSIQFMENEILQLTNHEGILYAIPVSFIGKETCVGDKIVSYQLLRLQRSGLFTMDELYTIAATIKERDPDNLINWSDTFMLLQKDKAANIRKRLKALRLA